MVSPPFGVLGNIIANIFHHDHQASILRQIVAGPRIRHEETGLDLVYVTDNSTSHDIIPSDDIKVYIYNSKTTKKRMIHNN